MILYDNRESLGSIIALYGSVIYKQVPVALAAAGVSVACVFWRGEASQSAPIMDHPFAAQTLSGVVSFALVWRTSLAWSRYWEGCTQTSFMYSKWADSFTQLVSFINYGFSMLEEDDSEEAMKKRAKLRDIRTSLAHNFSLISALASHRLTHGDLARMRQRSEKFGLHSSAVFGFCNLMRNHRRLFTIRQDLRFTDLTGAWELPNFTVLDSNTTEEVKAQAHADRSQHFLVPSSPTAVLKKVRSQTTAMLTHMRESGLSHHGKSGPSASSVEIGSIGAVTNITWSSDLVIIGELTSGEQEDLQGGVGCADRTAILTEWISEDINAIIDVCGIPPPIVSRCYQELSNGMAGLNQTIKMADIPFPFPFTQLLIVVLWTFTCTLPIYVAEFTRGYTMTPILTFSITLAMWSLCGISTELENPFSDGPNQLPVIDMHERFVEMLRTIVQLRRHRRKRKVPPPEEAAELAAQLAVDVNAFGMEVVEKPDEEVANTKNSL
eukprot:TRINITY_DN4451_c0_g1_i1.p1 TRINITY_DN4451_c0_g1~~TRINITY_DN4451_c0_g1_i1.p1  ORF type:complete len:494 (+),score=88.53 TRINITY_DN4451_c0_g1_i1:201-1682(+)